jgi:hypothetical protein
MPLFQKISDPLSQRERELRRELHRVEAELRKLAANPHATPPTVREPAPARRVIPERPEPLLARSRTVDSPQFNSQGVKKFDLIGAVRRLGKYLSGPSAYNKQMARMLAAGSIDGLPILRRERKRARLRFLFLFCLFLAILWGTFYSQIRQR